MEIARIRRAIQRTPHLRERVFTPAERDLPFASLAARWAAKEAARKALGCVLRWHDVEITSEPSGRPRLHVAGREDVTLHVSLSHTHELALAVVVAEWKRS